MNRNYSSPRERDFQKDFFIWEHIHHVQSCDRPSQDIRTDNGSMTGLNVHIRPERYMEKYLTTTSNNNNNTII